jgi:hypothetical protein
MNHPLLWSRILSSWIAVVTVAILSINQSTDNAFYQWGPHSELVLFGIVVDTWAKYSCVILYSVVNVSLRNVEQNILRPYLLLHVQDESVSKQTLNHVHIYEITVLVTLYTWFDWFMYMQMLLTQVDMIFIEAAADMVVSLVVTRWYLTEDEATADAAEAMKPMTYAYSYQSIT